MRCIARAVSYRLHPTNVFTRAVPYRYLPANILQVLLDHTNEECICRGTDLDHGIGNRDLICLMCAKLKFQTSKFSPLVHFDIYSLFFLKLLPGTRNLAGLWGGFHREVKSAAALTCQLVRVQEEMNHRASKWNSLAFRSTASHRLATSTYSYKYHTW